MKNNFGTIISILTLALPITVLAEAPQTSPTPKKQQERCVYTDSYKAVNPVLHDRCKSLSEFFKEFFRGLAIKQMKADHLVAQAGNNGANAAVIAGAAGSVSGASIVAGQAAAAEEEVVEYMKRGGSGIYERAKKAGKAYSDEIREGAKRATPHPEAERVRPYALEDMRGTIEDSQEEMLKLKEEIQRRQSNAAILRDLERKLEKQGDNLASLEEGSVEGDDSVDDPNLVGGQLRGEIAPRGGKLFWISGELPPVN